MDQQSNLMTINDDVLKSRSNTVKVVNNPNHKLQSNFVSFCILFLAISSIFASVYLWVAIKKEDDRLKYSAENKIQQQVKNIALVSKSHAESILRQADDLLSFIKYRAEKSPELISSQLDEYLKNKVFDLAEFRVVGVLNKQGKYIYTNNGDYSSAVLNDRDWFTIHKEYYPYSLYVSSIYTARISKMPTIQLTKRVNNKDADFNGVAAISLKPSYFFDFYKYLNLGKKSVVGLVGLDGSIHALMIDGEPIGVNENIRLNLPSTVLENNLGGFTTNKIIDNVDRVYGYSRLSDQPLLILVGISNELGMENYQITSKMYITIATLFTCFTVLLSICSLVLLIRQKKLSNANFILNKDIKKNNTSRLKDLSDLSRVANLNISKIVNKYNYLISQVSTGDVSIEISRIKDSLHEITDLVFSKLIRVKISSDEFKTEYSSVLLDEVIGAVLENFKNKLNEKNIELFFNIEPSLSEYIKIDKLCLVKIIKILISNAILQCRSYETLALNIKSSHDKKYIKFTLDAKMLESNQFIIDNEAILTKDNEIQEDALFFYADLDLARMVSEKIGGSIYLNEMHKLKFHGFQIPLQYVEEVKP